MRFAFATFVAAAAAQGIQTVLSDIQTIQGDASSLQQSLQGTLNAQSVSAIATAAGNLDSAIKSATSDVNAISGTVSEADQVSVLTAVAQQLYPVVISSLDAYVPVASQLDQLLGGAGVPASILKGIQTDSASLASALVSKATGQYQSIGMTIASAINQAFTEALSGTAPQAQSLPNIPSAGGSTGSSSAGGATTTATSAASSSVPVYGSSGTAVSTPAVYSSAAPLPSGTGYHGAAGRAAAQVGAAVVAAAGVAIMV